MFQYYTRKGDKVIICYIRRNPFKLVVQLIIIDRNRAFQRRESHVDCSIDHRLGPVVRSNAF